MVRQPNELFDKAKIKKYCAEVKITDEQRNAAKEWLGLLAENKLEKEDQNRSIFENIILQKILGFTVYDYVPEKANIDYTISNRESDKSLCIEVKGTSTKDLFAYQNRGRKDKENPIKQTWSYMGEGFDYGLCTNYEEFILLSRNVGLQKFYKFNFSSLKGIQNKLDEEKLKEFIGIFGKQSIFDDDLVTKITVESTLAEQEFTDEFYKLFHETRLMLIKEFSSLPDVTKTEAIHWAQIFLNRLIFIFFVEDQNFIPNKIFPKRIMDIIKASSISEYTNLVSDDIKGLFKIMNIGSKVHGINGFNGGLFEKEIPPKIYFSDLKEPQFFTDVKQNSKLSKKSLAIDIDISLSNRYADQLNPIIKNLLDMDSYDFTSDLNVNILGHIFEQSISDIEKLHEEISYKRKRDGVFYTPEYITDYICRNSIIRYLSKKESTSVKELVEEYVDNPKELEEKIKDIKILDPACGSGAFLIKAVEILFEIDKEVQELKPQIPEQKQLKDWSKQSEIAKIIENNIFGVDINEESVEITRLSLFLKLASNTRKLIGLEKNIKVGNSLIDDESVDPLAFHWEEKFPDIFHNPKLKQFEGDLNLSHNLEDGFDIIIGNPPWQILKPDVDEFFSPLYENPKSLQKFSTLNKIKKNEFMKKCLDDEKINNAWNEYLKEYRDKMAYFLESNKYVHQTSLIDGKTVFSDINLYKLFIEKSYKLLKSHGYCGLVVPSGIYSDLGAKGLRELLFTKNRLIHLFSFINRKAIFADVDTRFKFCTMLFQKEGITNNFLASFYVENVEKLANYEEIAYDYDMKLVELSSPNSLSLIECKNKTEAKILEKLYKYPLLISDEWNFHASREFHMTDDSYLFHTVKIGYPLFEGKMINSFTHIFAKPKYWIEENQGIEILKQKESNRMKKIKKNHNIEPQIDCEEYRLVWRSITNSTNERTLISTILPPHVFLGNSLNYLHPISFNGEKYVHPISYDETIFLCGIFNSFPIDFILRHRVATNLNIFYLMELPIPRFDKNNKLHNKLFKNSAKLICSGDDFSELRKMIDINDYVSDPEIRIGLEAQINALSAKIYNLTKEEFKFILDNFPIVDKKLKELTLDEFDIINL